jgi:hypothetical protein
MPQISIFASVAIMVILVALQRVISKKRTDKPKYGPLGTLIFILTLLFVLLLALTGFGTEMILHAPLEKLPLLAHVAFGGAFIVLLALLALFRGHVFRIGVSAEDAEKSQPMSVLRRLSFWSLLFFGMGTALTIVFSMMPIFGTHNMELLAQAHLCCALLTVMAAIGLAARA